MILGDAEVALNFLNLKENKFLFSFWIKTLSLKYNNDRFLLFISNLEIILIDNLIDLKWNLKKKIADTKHFLYIINCECVLHWIKKFEWILKIAKKKCKKKIEAF